MLNFIKKLFGNKSEDEEYSDEEKKEIKRINKKAVEDFKKIEKDNLSIYEILLKYPDYEYSDGNIYVTWDDDKLELRAFDNLKELPELVYTFKCLSRMNLSDCKIKSLANLKEFISLESLNLSYTQIEAIPTEIINLKKLKEFTIDKCENIKEIPSLPLSLLDFNISQTQIEELPENFYDLVKLKYFDISFTKISEISESIGDFKYLIDFNIQGCENIESLPENICNLKRLENLNLSETNILELPKDLGNLGNLKSLNLASTKICELPKSVTKLKKLEFLYLPKGVPICFTLKEMEKSGQLQIKFSSY